jgi:hypothetical protein
MPEDCSVVSGSWVRWPHNPFGYIASTAVHKSSVLTVDIKACGVPVVVASLKEPITCML